MRNQMRLLVRRSKCGHAFYPFLLVAVICLISSLSVFGEMQVVVDSLQDVVAKLKRAAATKDFSVLREYAPTSKGIRWGECNSDGGETMAVQEAVDILNKEAQKRTVTIFERYDRGMIETYGWSEPNSYIYFVFTKGSGAWKLSSICESPKRSIDFQPAIEK